MKKRMLKIMSMGVTACLLLGTTPTPMLTKAAVTETANHIANKSKESEKTETKKSKESEAVNTEKTKETEIPGAKKEKESETVKSEKSKETEIKKAKESETTETKKNKESETTETKQTKETAAAETGKIKEPETANTDKNKASETSGTQKNKESEISETKKETVSKGTETQKVTEVQKETKIQKETETQKVADSSVSYEPVKAEPVKSVDNNEIKDDSHEQPKKTSKYTTVMPNEEVERRITTFLGDMFKAMNLEVKIDVKFDDPDCVNVELSGPNMGVLIGKRGQTLDSIQYLTSLVVIKGNAGYVRVKVDTENYRARRKETLENLAKNIAFKVKRTKKPVFLEPMNPYERRVIHSALQNDPLVSTHSEGEEPYRKVVVTLKKQ